MLTVHTNLTESIYDVLGPEDSFGVAQVSIQICYKTLYALVYGKIEMSLNSNNYDIYVDISNHFIINVSYEFSGIIRWSCSSFFVQSSYCRGYCVFKTGAMEIFARLLPKVGKNSTEKG